MTMHPKDISIKDYSYSLPEEKIAAYPLTERDASKLLIYKQGSITEDLYRNIDNYLPANSLLIFNNTKVVEARLLFQKPTGGIIEIFCLEPHEQYPDITTAMLQQGSVLWKCLVGGASKWKRGQALEKRIPDKKWEIIVRATYQEKRPGYFIIHLSWSPENFTFSEILHLAGAVPLPPYIKRDVEAGDAERYQTIYADQSGSVAAPTAGLHFTENIFEKLRKKNIRVDFVTLHVGAGTFQPVKTEMIGHHEMHAEFIDVSIDTLKNILQNLATDIVAVGTTSFRTIESLYWIGVKLSTRNAQPANLNAKRLIELEQWEVYDALAQNLSPVEALQTLFDWMKNSKMERLVSKTQLMVAPGYKPKIVNGLITNFHQPNSTLLLLVAALIGEDWTKVYTYALENDFRFLSYGDGSLLWIRQRK